MGYGFRDTQDARGNVYECGASLDAARRAAQARANATEHPHAIHEMDENGVGETVETVHPESAMLDTSHAHNGGCGRRYSFPTPGGHTAYHTCGRTYAARVQYCRTCAMRERYDELQVAIVRYMPEGTCVDVSEWAESDEDWTAPVYVTAWPAGGFENDGTYYDAVADMDADTLDGTARFIAEQLTNG